MKGEVAEKLVLTFYKLPQTVKCYNICETIIDYLYEKSKPFTTAENAKSNEILIDFSEIELIKVVEAKLTNTHGQARGVTVAIP